MLSSPKMLLPCISLAIFCICSEVYPRLSCLLLRLFSNVAIALACVSQFFKLFQKIAPTATDTSFILLPIPFIRPPTLLQLSPKCFNDFCALYKPTFATLTDFSNPSKVRFNASLFLAIFLAIAENLSLSSSKYAIL